MNVKVTGYNFGRHAYYVEPESLVNGLEYFPIGTIMLMICNWASRISISLFLRNIFVTTKMWRWLFYVFTTLNTTSSLLPTILIILQCGYVDRIWNGTSPRNCQLKQTITAILLV